MKLDVLFIFTYHRKKFIVEREDLIIPLFSLSLASLLEKKGEKSLIYATPFSGFEKIENLVNETSPAVIIGEVISENLTLTLNILKKIKETNPSIKIFLIGSKTSHITYSIFKGLPYVDMIIRGEPQEVISDIADKNFDLSNISSPGLVYRTSTQEIKETKGFAEVANPDLLPSLNGNLFIQPEYKQIFLNYPFLYIALGEPLKNYRDKSLAKICLDAKETINDFTRFLTVIDEDFFSNPSKAETISKCFKESKNQNFFWQCKVTQSSAEKYPYLFSLIASARAVTVEIKMNQISPLLSFLKEFINSNLLYIKLTFPLKADALPDSKTLYSLAELMNKAVGRIDVDWEIPEVDFPLKRKIICWYQNFIDFKIDIYHKQYPNIPHKLLVNHFKLLEVDFKSPWVKCYTTEEGIKNYFNLLKNTPYKEYSDIPSNQILEWIPTRVYALFYKEKKAVIKQFNEEILLNPLETRIYELSGGKLYLQEIIQQLKKEKYTFSMNEIKDFYRKMEEKNIIIWSKI